MRAHSSLRLGTLHGTTPELLASPCYCAWGFCMVWEAGLPHKTSSAPPQRRNGRACSSLTARGGGLPCGVRERADQAQALVHAHGVGRQRRAGVPGSRVQPFDVRGVAHPVPLRAASEPLDACWRTIHNPAVGLDHPPPLVAFDDLGDTDMALQTEPWPSTLARRHGIAKGFPNRPD